MAYRLLGLLDVNMLLLYGEGGEREFQCIQQEFIRRSDDESIFTFRLPSDVDAKSPFEALALLPSSFRHCDTFARIWLNDSDHVARPPYDVAKRGLRFGSPATQLAYHQDFPIYKTVRYPSLKIQEQRQSGVRELYVMPLNFRVGYKSRYVHGLSWYPNGRCMIVLSQYDGSIPYRTIPMEHERDYSNLISAGEELQLELLIKLTNKGMEVEDYLDFF